MAASTPPPLLYTFFPAPPEAALTQIDNRIKELDSHITKLKNLYADLRRGLEIATDFLYAHDRERSHEIDELREKERKLRYAVMYEPDKRIREKKEMEERVERLEERLEVRLEAVRAEMRAEMKEREESLENRLEKVEAKERWLETLVTEMRVEIGVELSCVEKRLGAKIEDRRKRAWRSVFGFRSLKKGG